MLGRVNRKQSIGCMRAAQPGLSQYKCESECGAWQGTDKPNFRHPALSL
jgi:hypothetical protein